MPPTAHIVLTTDFSPQAERAYEPTVHLARRLGARITLLHVVEELRVVPHGASTAPKQAIGDVREEVERARTEIAAAAAKLGQVVPVQTEVVTAGDVVTGIADFARKQNADYVATATHGRTGLRRLILGSVAQGLVARSSVPVVCYPPQE